MLDSEIIGLMDCLSTVGLAQTPLDKKLEVYKAIELDHPGCHLGGSIGLFLQGIDLGRNFFVDSDIDICSFKPHGKEFKDIQRRYSEIGLASATAYLIGQLFDVSVFQRIREKFSVWWVAPLVSSVFANAVDTYVFFGTAFHNGNNEYMAANWLAVANADVVFKIIVSLAIILPTYGILLNYLQKKINN